MKKEFRRRRLEESRKKREETKERYLKEKAQRKENWQKKKEKDIVFLGKKKSGDLNNHNNDTKKLKGLDLPVFDTIEDLTKEMNITVNSLRFLCYSKEVSTVSHYIRFKIPKKTGGERSISAPMKHLKNAQHFILIIVLKKIKINDAAHGFLPSRSIVSNAEKHVNKEVVINLDLKDFFPTIDYKRIKGLFKSFGYSGALSTIFAILCSEPLVEEVELDGKRYYVSLGERHLPQGAPTSPSITNIICRRMDKRMLNIANKLQCNYTRYADDLTFSSPDKNFNVGKLLRAVGYIVKTESFVLHPDKVRVMRKSRRQEVTGVVVNKKINIMRKKLKKFRALLFQIEKTGPEGKKWGKSKNLLSSIKGFANYVSMVNKDKGVVFNEKIKKIIELWYIKN